MKTGVAILFTIGLVAASLIISEVVGFDTTWLLILGSSLWAAYDSSKIQLIKYKSGISYGPVVLFIGMALLWIIGFPWYLSMKHKIQSGTAQLKA